MTVKFLIPLFGALLLTGSASADVFDAVNDVSNTPALPATSGNWSYGYSSTIGGAFTAHSSATGDYFGDSKAAGYYTTLDGSRLPTVLKNITSGPIDEGTIQGWVNSLLLMHPGTSSGQDEYSVVRFTAPVSENYDISAAFEGLDIGPTTTDVHIVVNGSVDLFDSSIDSHLTPQDTFQTGTSLSLQAGDTIDFVVGLRADPGDTSISNDSTGFDAVITATPEPATFLLLAAGMAGLFLVRSRRTITT